MPNVILLLLSIFKLTCHMNLKDKVVVIIGGSRGFGRQLAEDLIATESTVIIASNVQEVVEQAASELGVRGMVADARNEENLRKLAEQIVVEFGRIDVWINSAGVFKTFPKDTLLDMNRAHELFDINFFGTVLGCRTALLHMKDKGGIVINMLSSAALDATRARNAKLYAASKWAVRGYIDALRGENKDSKVQILSVYPGGMKTHLHDEALPEDFPNFMDPAYVSQKVLENLQQESPELDLIIKRPTAS